MQGTVEISGSFSAAAAAGAAHEVELRLHTTITPHSITGYEINANTDPNNPYIQIVRWNGALGDFTLLDATSIGVTTGDVLTATSIGNTITVYKNGTQVLQATDSTYCTGSPDIGFYDNVDTNWTSFGFSHFSASNVGAGDTTPAGTSISPTTVQNDYSGIVRVALALDQATTVADAINAGTQTEAQYVNGLLAQVVGTSAEITLLATQFLPPQVANATQHGLNPQVYASEALGLAFAFQNETGSKAFANAFGPSNPAMPNSTAGDAAFAAAAAGTIFGSASTPNLVNAIEGYVANWKGFYTSNGISGVPNPTADQIDLAARGTVWGDAAGVALGNNLGPLNGQVTNLLYDAAQGIAVYSASLASQPTPGPFQGSTPSAPAALTDASVQLTSVAHHVDHAMI